jgi:signal peptidase I
VVVFIYPENPKRDFVKRLIATEGETVEIKNGTIYINDRPLLDATFSQRYYYNRGDFGAENQKITVPKDNYFVLGDNSASSQDSRYWGFVPKKNMLGNAIVIYWPPQRIRMVK